MSHERTAPVLVDGAWRASAARDTFDATDPATGGVLGVYPISPWTEIDAAVEAGVDAFGLVQEAGPDAVAAFLERFAERIEAAAGELVEIAHAETALAVRPRLADVELPRTANQMRQGAAAARDRSWHHPILSTRERIGSCLAPLPGPVVVFGPNNFPFAFNGAAGGDAVAALATGHPIIAKANPGHPGTTRILAREAHLAAGDTGLPAATVQCIYRTGHADGERLVADPRIAGTGFTGGRSAGLKLKQAADRAGKPIFLEMSSVNPVVVLPGAWRERGEELVDELVGSLLLGAGQFCTSPGLLFAIGDARAELRQALASRLEAAHLQTLLAPGVRAGLESAVDILTGAGARVVASGGSEGVGCTFPNTLLEVDGSVFLKNPEKLQTEAFGNVSVFVACDGPDELEACLTQLEGNLTGCVYSAQDGSDETLYARMAPVLRARVGRLLDDKVPTGVAVTGAMNHGGPFPATGHPGFTAVGIPESLRRFCALWCYDNVRDHRLPPALQASNPLGLQRLVNGRWTTDAVVWGE